MPVSTSLALGLTARATSVIRQDGMRDRNTSPPPPVSSARTTRSTLWSSVIQKRVMRLSVMGSESAPSAVNRRKKGMTEPRLPTTLP
jgi:hypothetical protein